MSLNTSKKKINLWNIPRSDTRERCAECLKVFKSTDMIIKSKKFAGHRFNKVHLGCVKKEGVV